MPWKNLAQTSLSDPLSSFDGLNNVTGQLIHSQSVSGLIIDMPPVWLYNRHSLKLIYRYAYLYEVFQYYSSCLSFK